MKFYEIVYGGERYEWYAKQDSEHPDFIFRCEQGEIWVQVELGSKDLKHNELYIKGQKETPISIQTVRIVISELIEKDYITSYFKSDVGLIYTSAGHLMEN